MDRFRLKFSVDEETGCWVWKEAVRDGEYPRFSHGGDRHLAHRWIWEQLRGPIPDGMDIDHINHCGCVNPDHLRLCTHAQNGQNLLMSRNNTSGYRGVGLHRTSGLWYAQVKKGGVKYSFGYHKTADAAGAAAAEGRRQLFTHSKD